MRQHLLALEINTNFKKKRVLISLTKQIYEK